MVGQLSPHLRSVHCRQLELERNPIQKFRDLRGSCCSANGHQRQAAARCPFTPVNQPPGEKRDCEHYCSYRHGLDRYFDHDPTPSTTLVMPIENAAHSAACDSSSRRPVDVIR